jgi:hypothetical protein
MSLLLLSFDLETIQNLYGFFFPAFPLDNDETEGRKKTTHIYVSSFSYFSGAFALIRKFSRIFRLGLLLFLTRYYNSFSGYSSLLLSCR